ncbi:MAG: hypothetical protein WC292_01785 [Clostridia bacterium]
MKIRRENTNGNLKDILTAKGRYFPCGGKGICGKCRILAPDLPPTNLDRRFFSDSDIQRGMRLACDKTIEYDIEIECYLPLAPRAARIDYPQIAAILQGSGIEVMLVGEDEVESVVLPLPEQSVLGLRAVVGKYSVEFFEKYKLAKAETILVAGEPPLISLFMDAPPPKNRGEVFAASRFDMPSETVYIPPVPNNRVGSDALLELLDAEENSLTVLCGQGLFLYKAESIIAASIGTEDDGFRDRALVATAKYFVSHFGAEKIFLQGEGAPEVESLFNSHGIAAKPVLSSATSAAVLALTDNRYKTRLDKLARKTELIDLSLTDEWQELFSE